MNKMSKYLLLLGSMFPLLWYFLYLSKGIQEVGWPVQIGLILVVMLIVTIVFLREIIRNKQLSDSQKATWLVLLLMFGSLTQVIYWIRWVL